MPTFQALSLSSFFREDCGVNVDCKPHVFQTDLFIKIYSHLAISEFFMIQLYPLYMTRSVSVVTQFFLQ
jgi:hypothetical protein